ncbi:MAG: hypothetical protein IJE97_04350, partial [Thermoguttaceae bacterium]|nr:hypothetical protein [Thermoguttaceae bacterium]
YKKRRDFQESQRRSKGEKQTPAPVARALSFNGENNRDAPKSVAKGCVCSTYRRRRQAFQTRER